tara:strand:- start:613 stop:1317 length:705 start_codon:yes stop_codon:yes gene_type:complete
LAYVWSLFKVTIPIQSIVKPGEILCFASKFVGEKKVYSRCRNDKNMLKFLHKQLSEADGIISYNGANFDHKWINGQFLLAGLPPPAPFVVIDLLRTIRTFRFTSNKLDYITQELGMRGKTKGMDFSIWRSIMEDNDPKAWAKMLRYNRNDVKITEALYLKIKPWVKHPNVNLYEKKVIDEMRCPACGSADHFIARGNIATASGVYKRYSCNCGRWFRGHEQIAKINVKNKTSNV